MSNHSVLANSCRREEERKARLALLRSNDMEGYLRAAQTSSAGKESRLKELLSSTDACLRQLSMRLPTVSGRPRAANQDVPATEEASAGLHC